jgi:hypothetical protein
MPIARKPTHKSTFVAVTDTGTLAHESTAVLEDSIHLGVPLTRNLFDPLFEQAHEWIQLRIKSQQQSIGEQAHEWIQPRIKVATTVKRENFAF